MCILKAFSRIHSFKQFAQATTMPVYSCVDKGEVRNEKRGTVHEEFRISFDVSEREWDDFPGQVEDAIRFLERWLPSLEKFKSEYRPDDLLLDFPLYSRLDSGVVNQNDTLPAGLITLAGRLGMSIGMSIYSKDAFEDP